jgi:hypothetical protein
MPSHRVKPSFTRRPAYRERYRIGALLPGTGRLVRTIEQDYIKQTTKPKQARWHPGRGQEKGVANMQRSFQFGHCARNELRNVTAMSPKDVTIRVLHALTAPEREVANLVCVFAVWNGSGPRRFASATIH